MLEQVIEAMDPQELGMLLARALESEKFTGNDIFRKPGDASNAAIRVPMSQVRTGIYANARPLQR